MLHDGLEELILIFSIKGWLEKDEDTESTVSDSSEAQVFRELEVKSNNAVFRLTNSKMFNLS